MRKRSDKEEYNINLAIFIGVILFSSFVIYSVFGSNQDNITSNAVRRVCPAVYCPYGYSTSRDPNTGCPTCAGSSTTANSSINQPGQTCPAFEDCISGTPVDSNGDGCVDGCSSASTAPVCGNGVCDTEESSSYDPPCAREACSGQYNPRGYTTCPQDCPGQPTQQESVNTCGNGVCDSGETASTCPNDCTQQATTSCYDTDGGKGYISGGKTYSNTSKGTATANNIEKTDSCYLLEGRFVQSCSGEDCAVMEAYCGEPQTECSMGGECTTRTNVATQYEFCTSNACSDGACVEATCSDSDGGDNIFEKGTVTYPNVDTRYNYDRCYDNGIKQFVESCSGPNCGLWEVWCGEYTNREIFTDSAFEYCPDTCGNGACTGEPAQATQCVEDWQCSDFTDCVNGEKLRSCIDNNQCGTTSDKPSLSQTCLDERNEPVTPNETTTSTVSESAETQLPAGSSQAASTTAQQPASTTSSQANNNVAAIIALVLFAGAIGVASFFIVQALGRKKLVKQLDEIMKRASSALQLNDLKGANSNYAVLQEYFSTYQSKIPKKDLVRLKEQGLKIYNEIVAKQNVANAVTAS